MRKGRTPVFPNFKLCFCSTAAVLKDHSEYWLFEGEGVIRVKYLNLREIIRGKSNVPDALVRGQNLTLF